MAGFTPFVIAALLSTASAQDFYVKCNPLIEDSCASNPAFGRKATCDFTKGKCGLFREADGSNMTYDDNNGAVFKMEEAKNAPLLESKEYIFYGSIEVELKKAQGNGFATTVVLQSDCLDEIDIEWVGANANGVTTNYFAKGNTSEANKEGTYAAGEVQDDFHNYTMRWTPRSISWSIDGQELRVQGRSPIDQGNTYPQTPSTIRLGTWVAGRPDAPEGTVEWAGGLADFSKGPSIAYIKRITITDFAGGDRLPKKRTKSYAYVDQSGSDQNISVLESNEDNEDADELNVDGADADPSPSAAETKNRTEGNESPPSPTSSSETTEKPNSLQPPPEEGLSTGAKAGIAVGAIATASLAIGAVAFVFWRKQRRAREHVHDDVVSPTSMENEESWDGEKNGTPESPAEMNGLREPAEVSGKSRPQEMNGESLPQEMDTKREPVELDSTPIHRRFSFDRSSRGSSVI